MYSFEPNQEQQMLIDAVSRYARGDLRPAGREAEESKSLPRKLIGKGWELGLLQASIPEAYGGFGERSAVTGVLAAEEMAWGDLAGALAVMTPALFAMPVLLSGSEAQKLEWIEPLIEGNWPRFSGALIEPSFDFDPDVLKTTASLQGDHFVLNGVKTMVPFAAGAEALLVYANLNGATKGFIVPGASAGLSVSEPEKFMSLNALPLYRVTLADVKIPQSHILEGDFGPVLAAMRVANAALALGVANGALEYARDYAKEREAFGVKIAQKQAIAFMLAEMATEIESIRLLTWEAAWMLDVGKDEAFTQAYLAATGAADMVMMVTDRAVQVLGGHGYIREHPVEMWMRNGRGFASFTGLAIV
ncbi:MAG: acyl-CoA dehydrogenase family protein [Anaerolineales bacterium]|jgi:alkylation response protein AidB-like acyl-CoA dehydrogenase|nr:acyl-CoA dehydrogenase family protein [Anaerolineales bacterium]